MALVSRIQFRVAATVGLLCVVWLSGCEDTFIDPYNNDDRYFTVYGFLDQNKNFQGATQSVRVIPVTREPEKITSPDDPQASIDARVFLIDQNDETTVELSHALLEFEPGIFGHLFSTRYFVQPGHRYRLEVRRKDGIITYAETHAPAVSSIQVMRQDPLVNADSSVILQDLMITDVSALWDLEVIYYTGSCFNGTRNAISYGRTGAPTSEGWAVQVDISKDLATIQERQQNATVLVCAMGLKVQVLDDQWTLPEGEINLDEVSLPNVQTNIVNGYGYFGSLSLYQSDWPLNNELQQLLLRY